MRVLFLPPSSRTSTQLSRRTFLDEEIRALANAGVDAFVLSPNATESTDSGRIHVRPLPADTLLDRAATVSFLARRLMQLPLGNLLEARQCYRAARLERAAADIVRRERIQLIHSYFGWPRGFGGLLAKFDTGVPLLAALRGCDVNVRPEINYGLRLDPAFDRAFRRLLRCADMTVSVSRFLREEAVRLGAPCDRARVILKGVRVDLFRRSLDRTAARRQLGLPLDRPILLAVAGLISVKGLPDILRSLALLERDQDFLFVVCGDGPEAERLLRDVATLRLSDRVSFPGRVSRQNIGAYFDAADIFVQGSVVEASGNALLEAAASGLPVVCTDAGGPREYVLDGETAFLVTVGDVSAMAERIRALIDDPMTRARMGLGGRDLVESRFSYDRMIADTIALYGELTAPRGRAVAHLDAAIAGNT